MYGLIVLGIFLLYIAGCIVAVRLTIKQGRKRQWKYPWIWGLLIFLLYNTPVAQYVIPPMIAMNQYCEQSGFWLYKTPEQWKQENPGVAETLTLNGRQVTGKSDQGKPATIFYLNERFEWVIEYSLTDTKNVQGVTEMVVDRKTREVMAKKIDFKAFAYPLYAPDTCFRKAEREKWVVDDKIFIKYKRAFQFLGEKQ